MAISKALVAAGANVNARTAMGNTVAYLATQKQSKALLDFLVGAGADAALGNDKGETPMHMALFLGSTDLMAHLLGLAGRACLEALDARGYSPLHYSVMLGRAEAFQFLIQHGADPSRRSGEGLDLFLLAIKGLQVRAVVRVRV